ncbi:POK9 protein, partial [Alopecoenas beccarii]|nr:POK9 protein [Alopecoenas beccarii]
RGSLGVDIDVTLKDNTVHKIPTNAKGPLLHQDSRVGGILLGHSSAGIKGIIVVPGVIDADYTGVIHAMVYTTNPPIFIPAGSKVAQIVALSSNQPVAPNLHLNPRGDQGFGSTGPRMCFTTTMAQRPMMRVQLFQSDSGTGPNLIVDINAMLDTGADVTIIS